MVGGIGFSYSFVFVFHLLHLQVNGVSPERLPACGDVMHPLVCQHNCTLLQWQLEATWYAERYYKMAAM